MGAGESNGYRYNLDYAGFSGQQAAPWGNRQVDSHSQRDPESKQTQGGEEEGTLQHRHIVVHQRSAFADECRCGDADCSQHGQCEGAGTQRSGSPVMFVRQCPDDSGHGQKPNQYGLIDMDNQCGTEEIDPGQILFHPGRAGQHQQNSKQTGDAQCQHAQLKPTAYLDGVVAVEVRDIEFLLGNSLTQGFSSYAKRVLSVPCRR